MDDKPGFVFCSDSLVGVFRSVAGSSSVCVEEARLIGDICCPTGRRKTLRLFGKDSSDESGVIDLVDDPSPSKPYFRFRRNEYGPFSSFCTVGVAGMLGITSSPTGAHPLRRRSSQVLHKHSQFPIPK